MASLASLVVDLQLESAQLRSGLDRANEKLEAFGKKADKVGKTVAQALGAKLAKDAIIGLGQFVMGGAHAAEQMGDLAQSSGTTVESFSKLAYAARLSGSSAEEMGSALGKLSRTMTEATSGGAQAQLFQAIGVSITDASGKMRSSTDVFRDVSEAFSRMEDGAAKTALAQEIFGKSGAALIPIMNEGAEGIDRAAEEAERFGHVVTEEGAASSEKFNKAMTRMGMIGEGLAQRVAQNIAPQFSALADELVTTASKSGVLEGAAKVLAVTMKTLASAGLLVKSVMTLAGQGLAFVAAAVVEAVKGNFAAIPEQFDELGKQGFESLQQSKKEFEALWSDAKGPGEALEKQEKKVKVAADGIIRRYEAMKDAAKEAADESARLAREFDKNFEKSLEEFRANARDEREGQLRLGGTLQGIDEQRFSRDFSLLPNFETFNQALDYATAKLKEEAVLREKARILAKYSAEEALQQSLAADAAARLAVAAEQAASNIQNAFPKLVDKMTSRMGNIMGLIDSATTGAKAGGVWGAVGAVAADLLTQSEQFVGIIDDLDAFIQRVADTLGIVLGPALVALEPLLGWVAGLLQTLAPIFQLVGNAIGGIIDMVNFLVEAIAAVWNGIIDAINWALGWLGVDLSSMKWVMADLRDATEDQTVAAEKAAKANDQLTNVPSGYKVALARFEAMTAQTGAGTASPPSVTNNITINAGDLSADEVLTAAEERILRARGHRLWGGSRFGTVRDY